MTTENEPFLHIERTLGSVWKKARSYGYKSRTNLFATLAFTIIIACLLATKKPSELYKFYVESLSFILQFYSSILGFLIGGFAIITALIRPEVAKSLLRTKRKSDGLNYLENFIYGTMLPFCHYIFYITIAFAIKLAIDAGLLSNELALWAKAQFPKTTVWSFWALLVIFAAYSFYVLLQAKSFIYNVYFLFLAITNLDISERNIQANQPTQNEGTQENGK